MAQRGKGFPRLSLSGAVQIMDSASKFGKTWKREQFAGFGAKGGAGSAKSGAFAARVSSLRDYSLIISDKESIASTDLAQKITKPINQQEREESIKQAFLSVVTFGDMYDNLDKKVQLPKDQLASYAVNNLGVARESKDKFVNVFIDSGGYAGLVEHNKESGSVVLLQSHNNSLVQDNQNVEEATPSESANGGVSDFINNLTPGAVSAVKRGDFVDSATMNEQGVNHSGDGWGLTVLVKSSHRLPSDLRKSIRDLLETADEVADKFYDLEKMSNTDGDE